MKKSKTENRRNVLMKVTYFFEFSSIIYRINSDYIFY